MKVAKALIYDKDGRVLILRRSETHPHFPHEADLAGGVIDQGEEPLMAVVREIDEETGLIVDPTDLTLVCTRTLPSGRLDYLYTCRLDAVQPKISVSWEHEAYEWIDANNLSNSITTKDDYMEIVTQYLAQRQANKS